MICRNGVDDWDNVSGSKLLFLFYRLLLMTATNVWTTVKRFDAFSKTQQEFQIRTTTGAVGKCFFLHTCIIYIYCQIIVTIVSLLFAVILFVMELTHFLSTSIHTELLVDTARNQKLQINLNITFHNLPCSFLTVDAMDVSGAQQHNIMHSMSKQRLTLNGEPIDKTETLVPNERNASGTVESTTTPAAALSAVKNACGSCYGAESTEMRCCNTCEAVRTAYRKKGWRLDAHSMSTMEQCKDEAKLRAPGTIASEGCLIQGVIEVNKVGGNVHIAPGHTFKEAHGHVHDMQDLAGVKLNTSHRIDHLSFGIDYPDRQNALDGVEAIANHG